jgi:hypothetical protein
MPKFVIERQYLLPVFQHLVVEADTLDEACQKAIHNDDWESAVEDGDGSRCITISAAKEIPEDKFGVDTDIVFDFKDPPRDYSLGTFLYENEAETGTLLEIPEQFTKEDT